MIMIVKQVIRPLLVLAAGISLLGGVVHAQAVQDASQSVPDISGPWQVANSLAGLKTVEGGTPPLTAAGKAAYAKNKASPADDPIKGCLPPGVPRAMLQKGFPFKIVQGKTMYGMVFQWNHLLRTIYMNTDHFEGIGPQYFGQSVGHWEGDTLLVDTNAYNSATYLDDSGLPHTAALTTLERIKLASDGTLEDRITFTDAEMYSRAWTAVLTFKKRAGVIIEEDYCLGRTGQGKLKQE